MESRQAKVPGGPPIRPATMPFIHGGSFAMNSLSAGFLPLSARGAPSAAGPSVGALPTCPSPVKRQRKERQPNWLPQEIHILIRLKREFHIQEIDATDRRDLMMTESNKWTYISQEITGAGFSPCPRDAVACKTKWNQLVLDYKKISDYCSRTGRNMPEYWQISTEEKKKEGLPRHFSIEYFNAMHEWLSTRAQIQPLHVRDLLSPHDANFEAPPVHEHDDVDEENNDPSSEDMQLPSRSPTFGKATDWSAGMSPSKSNPTASRSTLPPVGLGGIGVTSFPSIPHGVVPQVISSSDNTANTVQRRSGNTGVKRKHVSGHYKKPLF